MHSGVKGGGVVCFVLLCELEMKRRNATQLIDDSVGI